MQKPIYAIEINGRQHFVSTYPVFILTSRGYTGFCIYVVYVVFYLIHVLAPYMWWCTKGY